jgi:hypothetical protein
MELELDQLGDLSRNVCHWVFRSVQPGSRGKHRTDFAERLIRCAVHDRDEQATREQEESSLSAMLSFGSRRNSAGVTRTIPTFEFANPLSMVRSNEVPRRASFWLNQTETPRASSRSCNSVTEKGVPQVGHSCSLLYAFANRRECLHLGRRVHHRRTCP